MKPHLRSHAGDQGALRQQPAVPPPDACPLQNAVLASLLWIAVILIVFVPVTIQRYKMAVRR